MDTRPDFLSEFLHALGAQEIRNLQVSPDHVSGTVFYDMNDLDEQQEFRWSVLSDSAPSPTVTRLVALIRRDKLLQSDKLKTSRQELLARFNAEQDYDYSLDQFSVILDELLQIRVHMLDDGVETDYYFIHE